MLLASPRLILVARRIFFELFLRSPTKGYLNKSFSMTDLREDAYILSIKIYRDRSTHLIGLSQSTYLDKVLKKFKMDQSKKGFLHVLHV